MAQIDKIMSIYYGIDKLPYKDTERTIHYPMASGVNTFVGENNTTKIRFYVDLIGGVNYTWLATIKKPDGSLAYKLLNGASSGFVDLDLSLYTTNQVGAIYISLTGYTSNDVHIEEDDGVYSISGNPQMLVTGVVKIMVGYAPTILRLGEDTSPTIDQQILAFLDNVITKEKSVVVFGYRPTQSDIQDYQIGQVILVMNGETKLYKVIENQAGAKVLDEKFDFDKFPNFTKQEIEDLLDELEENLQEQIDDNKDDADAHFSDINDKIPTTASATNKLVDRDTMNSSITQSASFFRGNFETQNDLTSKNWQTTNPSGDYYVTNNDYAVVNEDETHNGETWRYKAVVSGNGIIWHDEYRVNNSAFTSDQWASINSGMTNAKRVGYDALDSKKQNKVLYGADKFDEAQDGDIIVVDTTENFSSLGAGRGIEFENINGVNYVKNGIHYHTIEIGISSEYLADNPEFPYDRIYLTLLSFSNAECHEIADLYNMPKLNTMPTIIKVRNYQDSKIYKAFLLGFTVDLHLQKFMIIGKFDNTSEEDESVVAIKESMTSYMVDIVG